jgi:hypothetical protein
MICGFELKAVPFFSFSAWAVGSGFEKVAENTSKRRLQGPMRSLTQKDDHLEDYSAGIQDAQLYLPTVA